MSNLFAITIPDSAAALLVTYGAGALIRVQSAPTEGGIYGNVETLAIETGVSTYSVYDPDGISSDWYKIRYEAADGDPASTYADAFQPMPQSGIYASLSQFEAFIRDSDTADRDLKLFALDSASRAIDRFTNRRFTVAAETATARIFTPYQREDGRYVVPIDDTFELAGGVTVMTDNANDSTYLTEITDFAMGPANALVRGRPYTELVFGPGAYAPLREDSVEVTCIWDWPSVPLTITNACLIQAARFYKRRDAAFGIAGSPENGNEMRLLARIDPDVQVMVNTFKRWFSVIN